MELKFGEEQMRAVVTKAILDGLGEDQKALIITQAVEHLMGTPPSRDGYSYNTDKRNRLQRAFDEACEFVLQKVAREEVAKPENVERIRVLLGPIIEQVLSGPSSYAAQEAVASAITTAFNKRD